MALNEAFLWLKDRRPAALPNIGFWRQLEQEELKLFGVASPTPPHYRKALEARVPAADIRPAPSRDSCGPWDEFRQQLPVGALSWAQPALLDDLERDLHFFSSLLGVRARAERSCDQIVIS